MKEVNPTETIRAFETWMNTPTASNKKRIVVFTGAGVSAENYMQIVQEAGVSEVHGSFKGGVPVRD